MTVERLNEALTGARNGASSYRRRRERPLKRVEDPVGAHVRVELYDPALTTGVEVLVPLDDRCEPVGIVLGRRHVAVLGGGVWVCIVSNAC